MAFDELGFREEAEKQGVSKDLINEIVLERTTVNQEVDTLASGTGEFFGPPEDLAPVGTGETSNLPEDLAPVGFDTESIKDRPSSFATVDTIDEDGFTLNFTDTADNFSAIINNMERGSIARDVLPDIFGQSTTGQLPVNSDSLNFALLNMIRASGREDVVIRFPDGKFIPASDPITSKREFKDVEVGFMSPDGETFTPLSSDSSFLDDVLASKFEMGGSLIGGLAGLKTGTLIGAELGAATGNPVLASILTGTGAIVGTGIGGFTGASVGRGLDILEGAIRLRQDLDFKTTIKKAIESGEDDMLLSAVGVVGMRVAKIGIKTLDEGIKKLGKSALNTNVRAFKSIKRQLLITDEEADVYISKYIAANDINTKVLSNNEKLKLSMQALIEGVPGSQDIIAASITQSKKIGPSTARRVRQRSLRLEKTIKGQLNNRTIKNLGEDFVSFTSNMGAAFGNVRSTSIKLVNEKLPDFTFDASGKLIKPFEEATGGFKDPNTVSALKEQVDFFIEQADDKGLNKFSDLIELRSAINGLEFKEGNVRLIEDVRDKLKANIDKEITNITKNIDVDGQPLSDIITRANVSFEGVKEASTKSLGKLLTGVGKGDTIEDSTVIEALRKTFVADAEEFTSILSTLPKHQQENIEIVLLDFYRDKAAKDIKNEKIINFVSFYDSIADRRFNSKAGKQIKTAVKILSQALRNETPSAAVTPGLQFADEASGVVSSVAGRGKIEFARSIFNFAKRFSPSQRGADINMVMKAAQILNNPTSQKGLERLIRGLPEEAQNLITQQVELLRFRVVQDSQGKDIAGKVTRPTVQLFRVVRPGKEFKKTSGKLGNEVYYKRNVTKVDLLSGDGKLVINTLEGRIATEEIVRAKFNIEGSQSVEEFFNSNRLRVKDTLRRGGNTFIEIGDDLIDLN